MSAFWLGVLHPAETPSLCLALLALGLVLAARWPERFGRCWAAFALASLIGLGLPALAGGGGVPGEVALLGAATILALFAVAAGGRAVVAIPALAAVAGLVVGAACSPGPGPRPLMIATAAGAFVGLNLGVLYLAGGTGWLRQRLPRPWAEVGLRIAAAWVAAVAGLLLALQAAAT